MALVRGRVTALVLSGGGLFGAYQAGAWRSLEKRLRPDIVIGASVGSLNGWLIAAGCSPQALIDRWLDPGASEMVGRPFDNRGLERVARALVEQATPAVGYGVVVVEIPRLRSCLVCAPNVTWRHLAASCAVPGQFVPVRIGKKWFVDGGLLKVLPLWAAPRMGATRIIAVNVLLPGIHSALLRYGGRVIRAIAGERLPDSAEIPTILVGPEQPLGSLRDAVRWNHDNVKRWIEMGEEAGDRIALSQD